MNHKILNIAILAHADAGKTSLVEQFLHKSGQSKHLGSVDKGTTVSDTDPLEIERGISIKLSDISFEYKNCVFNIIDTPGHVDFSSEVEYALKAIDMGILLVSAVEGLQSQTLTLLHALEKLEIPSVIFINKIDREGTQIDEILDELKRESKLKNIIFCKLEERNNLVCPDIFSEEFNQENLIDSLSDKDESLLNAYLNEEKITPKSLKESFKTQFLENQVRPILLGSAKEGSGIQYLLDNIVDYGDFNKPKNENEELSATVFKISEDKQMGTIAHVRVISGTIENRKEIWNQRSSKMLKPSRINITTNQKLKIVNQLTTNEIGLIAGLSDIRTGDTLGTKEFHNEMPLDSPLMTVEVEAKNQSDYTKLANAFGVMNASNPLLNLQWLREEQKFHLDVRGTMQIEILESELQNKYSIEAIFSSPNIKYKETPKQKAEGYVCYWMPKPCWAIIKFEIEPAERGSGISFKSIVPLNAVSQKYQNEVEKTIPKALEQGIKGWPVTDIKITMIEGEEHNVHTRPSDFVIATPMGIMEGLTNTGTSLLEPILEFKMQIPEELLGEIISDVTKMRGSIESPNIKNGKAYLEGKFPLASSLEYSIKFNSKTKGKGKLLTKLVGYEICEDDLGVIRPFNGINPLDTAKYILKARKAITESFK